MRHATFASLTLAQRAALIEGADFTWPFETTSIHSNGEHTYVSVAIQNGRGENGIEHASYLVCPQNVTQYHVAMLAKPTFEGRVYFDSGHYGMSFDEAVGDAAHRARR